ncbi:MAG: hypothetical protein HY885_03140 [Deltaproteobacteria bacterium]|nr:hypothetical protein [Deltaproteobacteria bacterium]
MNFYSEEYHWKTMRPRLEGLGSELPWQACLSAPMGGAESQAAAGLDFYPQAAGRAQGRNSAGISETAIRRVLPALLWQVFFLIWLGAFAALVWQLQGTAGMGNGLLERYQREKTLEDWSRRQPAPANLNSSESLAK